MLLQDISYRYKIPLTLSLVILLTASVVSVTLVAGAYRDAKEDLVKNGLSLGKVLARSLRGALLHDDVWQAYETINTPFDTPDTHPSAERAVVVLDAQNRVYVSTRPQRFHILQPLASVDPLYATLARKIGTQAGSFSLDDVDSRHVFMIVPIHADDGTRLGTLLLTYSGSLFLPKFYDTVEQVLVATLAVLLLLLPLGWYWGKQLSGPLTHLAECMGKVGREAPSGMQCTFHESKDEIGLLSNRFKQMLNELQEKQQFERQVVASNRLAAIGKLTAGIAHEINNPLGGMLNAISTYKRHGTPDAMSERTLSLVERGLCQIKETVGALLVEAKLESHALMPADAEDVRTLILPDLHAKSGTMMWENRLTEPLPLPSTQVRQILLNLLLNAVHAIKPGGNILCSITSDAGELAIQVANDGNYIKPEKMEHLFEPFTTADGEGHGLGLWITYQLVTQLGGRIQAYSAPERTQLDVVLPMEN